MTIGDFMAQSSANDGSDALARPVVTFSDVYQSKTKNSIEGRSSLEETQTSGFGDEEANRRLFQKLSSPQ